MRFPLRLFHLRRSLAPQIGFIDYIVRPAFNTVGNVLPRIKEVCIPNLEVNRKHYEILSIQEESESEMKCEGNALSPTEESSEADSRPGSMRLDFDAEADNSGELSARMGDDGAISEERESATSS
jgi:hypothetical protein